MKPLKNILISGAGPSGLSMAIFLAELGYKPRIIDQKNEISQYSKALAVNPMTLEIFESFGITDRFLSSGKEMSAINIYKVCKHIFRNDLSKVNHRYPFMLIQTQRESEKILLDEVLKRGIEVEYGTSLDSYSIENEQVVSAIRKREEEIEYKSDLIIGADGGRSKVREVSGIQYKGFRYDEDWEILDVELDTPLHPDEGHIFLYPAGGMIMIPFHNDIWRLAGSLKNIASFLPTGTKVNKVIWESEFKINHKVAESLTQPKVALIGDAAHLHSPVGARGMNLGIQDASILSGLIAQDRVSDFDKVRLPYLKKTVNRINNITMALAGDGVSSKMIRKNIHLIQMVFPLVMPTVRKFIMGLNK